MSFQNTFIILTSNIGSEIFGREQGLGFEKATRGLSEKKRQAVLSELKKMLRPELLGRIEHVLMFEPLSLAALRRIAKLELEALARRLKERSVTLSIDPSAIALVSQKSTSPEQGARLIRKIIQGKSRACYCSSSSA